MGVRFKSHSPPRQGGGTALRGVAVLELDYPALGEYAEKLVERSLRRISMSKMRRLHQEIVRIREIVVRGEGLEECRKLLPRLRYLLAYIYGRLGGGEKRNFEEYMETLKRTIDALLHSQDPEKLREGVEKLYMFSEAIVAYHKYYEEGGRRGR